MSLLGMAPEALAGILACSAALVLAAVVLLEPGHLRLASDRRRPVSSRAVGGRTGALTDAVERLLLRRDVGLHVAVLERAGARTRLATVALRVVAGAVVAGLLGLAVGGLWVGLVLALAVPLLVRVGFGLRARRRRVRFANQLEDSMQLLASGLRAGHSFIQALETVARDSPEPTRAEFTQVLNESRVGRDVGLALDQTAVRMASSDLAWVAEALAINREVGGNLAEILDRVTHTIRERNQLRRQVATLSAEGKMSAYVLMALPFGITAALLLTSRSYILRFTEGLLGYALMGAAVVLLVLGALWLRKVVTIRF